MKLTLLSRSERRIRASQEATRIQRTLFAGLSQEAVGLPKTFQSYPLSPGERAGVRASVNPNPSVASAFTLIELMIVIVLIGILSALIIPEMKGGYQDALLRSTGRNLVNAFSIASSRAISLNQLHRVRLDAKTGRYVIEKRTRETVQGDEFAPLKDVSEAEGTLDTRISIQVRTPEQMPADTLERTSSAAAANGPTIDTISFYSDGTADSAELLLRDRQGFRLLLRINSITSRVKVLELERE
jgi:prepilin-type N-terminal cleavage/methylation domain-containing protein